MDASNTTKINRLLQMQPSGAVLLSSWMKQHGISYELQRNYKESGWFDAVGTGAMIRKGETPTWQSALHGICNQSSSKIHVGAKSALALHGYAHYMEFNQQQIELFSERGGALPTWFIKYDWGVHVSLHRTNFLPSDLGLFDYQEKQFSFSISTPARAMMEYLFLSTKDYEFIEGYQIMESLTLLRPLDVQELLENCHSVKVVRLFLYMAEKANHSWMKYIDKKKLNLGVGKRNLVKNGTYIDSFQITIPKELTAL
jgi:hypothetical protein